MISYVILISIVVALSIGVFLWLRTLAGNVEPPADCKEGTSIALEDHLCLGDIRLNLKNNGRFNIDGIILTVGNDTTKTPTVYLLSYPFENTLEGHYVFNPSLKPGESREAKFSANTKNGLVPFDNIAIVQIQPFIIDKNNVIRCTNSVITQEIENCRIK